ncbi:hypothetical protein COV82_03235 [Candidatus Peregrinibacteria bacterium CG11_big_fil_rev_8_21_14_0_20_46_8]|nr:MAG: hypothetical protein COV82_03235 [Candidatus Peregrinibacteria bacterium CG11_big_fil_rev_8_21_14_0_20_46_8]
MKFRIVILLTLPLLLSACAGDPAPSQQSTLNSHVHGLAVDRSDSSHLYIATHNGLFLLSDDKNLELVGTSRDDYMGFSPHPTDSKIFFSSGHPASGGNMGVRKSTNGGETWKKLTNGDPSGPVDFHAMTVSEANPALIYGYYRGYVYRSEDSGETWEILQNQIAISSLATHPRNEEVVYAGTNGALIQSQNKGEDWEPAFLLEQATDAVLDIEVDRTGNTLWITTLQQGVLRANLDSTVLNFETMGALPGNKPAVQLAADQKNPGVLYAAHESNIYKSSDSGKNWQKIL